jgi:hypothetical protein
LTATRLVDSFKTVPIADHVWRTRSQLELAIVEYLGWFTTGRLHQALGDLPPPEFEALAAPRSQMTTVRESHGFADSDASASAETLSASTRGCRVSGGRRHT